MARRPSQTPRRGCGFPRIVLDPRDILRLTDARVADICAG
jgi:hypothetical protein